jgi:peptidoglycan/xylan/chitin deacetylase (PgdA/CDA1 family)
MRRGPLQFLVLLLVLGVSLVGLHKLSKAECFSLTGETICHVKTTRPLVALTFDDGPTDQGLAAVLPVLDHYHARATFFLIGKLVRPPLVHQILRGGHEIGNHSFHHKWMIFHGPGYYDEEIDRTDEVLISSGAPRPTLFRPPYGKKLIGLPLAVQRNGKRLVMWDSGDPADRDPRAYARKVMEKVRPGSIILIHPMYPANATERAALPLIMEDLRRRGLRSVTVSELLASADS